MKLTEEDNMYIFIMEGGEIYRGDHVEDDDKKSADSGILDIIDCQTQKQYYEGEWHDMEGWGS